MLEDDEIKNAIVFGYAPLIEKTKVQRQPDSAMLEQMVEDFYNTAEAEAYGCFWVEFDNGSYAPVLCYPRAKEYAEHLYKWSEQSPRDWFRYYLLSEGDSYMLGIMQEVQNSINRFKLAFKLTHLKKVPDSAKCTLIQKPLQAFSINAGETIKNFHKVPETINLGFISVEDANKPDTFLDNVHWVGPIDRGEDEAGQAYMDKLFEAYLRAFE